MKTSDEIFIKLLSECFSGLPAVTDFPELISWNTADIPVLGCDGVASEPKRHCRGGGGAAGAWAAHFPLEVLDADKYVGLPTGPQRGPSG